MTKTEPQQKTIDESKLESLLQGFKPIPSSRFAQKIKTAPWITRTRPSLRRPFLVLVGSTAILALVALAYTITPLHALAQQLFVFFWPEPQDRLVIRTNQPTPEQPNILGGAEYFPLSFEEAQRCVLFPVLQITHPPKDLYFRGAYCEPEEQAVTLLYESSTYRLILTQRHLVDTQALVSIGASALVEPVLVGRIPGEFVAGSWTTVPTNPKTTQTLGTQAVMDIVWDPLAPKKMLLWQDGEMYYILRGLGEGTPSKEILISIAESLE